MADETILVTPRSIVFQRETLVFQGLETDKKKVDKIMSHIAKYGYLLRSMAETNTNFKQPIPYAIIRRGREYFLYKRLSGGGEERLYNKFSIGVGGHMNVVGTSKLFANLLKANMLREIEEELIVSDENFKVTTIGLINDDEDEVGRVHIGILAIVDVAIDSTVEVRETDVLEGEFVTLEELRSEETYNMLENWSKIAVDALETI